MLMEAESGGEDVILPIDSGFQGVPARLNMGDERQVGPSPSSVAVHVWRVWAVADNRGMGSPA